MGLPWGTGGRGSEHRDPRDSEAARRERACQMGLPPGVDPADLPFTLQRTLGAIAILGCTDLLSQEHILLLARPQLQELSVGSPGPVTNKATKVGSHWGPKQWVWGHPFSQMTLLSLSFAARTGRALRTAVRASPGTCSGNAGPLPGPGTPPEPARLTAQQLCSEGSFLSYLAQLMRSLLQEAPLDCLDGVTLCCSTHVPAHGSAWLAAPSSWSVDSPIHLCPLPTNA